jgi:hypothetical protein
MSYLSPLRWSIISLVALLLIWRVISVNLHQHAEQLNPDNAARWQQQTSALALQKAIQMTQSDPKPALQKAIQHAWKWPTDAEHWLLLAMMLEQQNNTKSAQALMVAMHQLFPRQPLVQVQIGNFWLRQGEVRRTITHWGAAMEMQPGLRSALFPDLLAIAEIPAFYPAVNTAFANAGAWSEAFFLYAVQHAAQLDTLKLLYQSRQTASVTPTSTMQRVYLQKLIQQQVWTDAYFVWINTLNSRALDRLGNVFDGGFEVETPVQGFAWQWIQNEGVRVQPERTLGASGKQALHISFLGTHKVNQAIATQQLLLDPGSYRLQGKFKVENLSAINGLSWELRCPDVREPIAKTPYFVDKTQWQIFTTPAIIPEGCEAPVLALVLSSADAKRSNLTGSIWFDDLALVLVQAAQAKRN